MSDLGALLRKAREQRKMTLDDIQDLTKIQKRYLEAIEEGNYNVLPGTFYVRAFVKNYSEAVGLDAEEVLRLYNNEVPAPVAEQVAEPMQRPRRARTQSSDRWSRWGFRTLMWSFLLLIVVVVYVFAINKPGDENTDSADQSKITDETKQPEPNKNNTDNKSNTDKTNNTGGNNTAKEPDVVTPEPDPVTPPVAAATVTLKRSSGRTDYYEISTSGTHKLELKVSGGACWIGVKKTNSKGESLLSESLQDGDTKSFEVDGPVFVNVGRADLVEVSIDGVVIDDGNKSGPRKLQVDVAADAVPST
ncbi:DUF4115 domain-containing protein [Paenibacillus oenotherae]|uniref:DUF4115 domain-containing protein n=1 Tax=Paenibacillus oenotherae TaxID=1435645 RepID=A0ABS7D083_9BACL|nr:RodZ domain-containing protein [Paenibacillus oenotherae]MBW7473229.1 DUF4115 domain-containing protein [Paenibacillus oenotherae]